MKKLADVANEIVAREENWLAWIARVELLHGRPCDRERAREAWACDYGPGERGMTADEYAVELAWRKL
jgi:hypothetical protein